MRFSWSRTLVGAVSSFIVWSVHFVAVYALVGLGCERDWDGWDVAGANALSVSLIGATLPALALIGWIGWIGWRWQRAAEDRELDPQVARRWRFMGLLTVALAVLAFVSTFMTAVPVVMLPPCELN